MRRIALLVGFTLVAWGWCAALGGAAQRCPVKAPGSLMNAGALTVGTAFGTPPQNFLVDNKPTGSDVEIMEAVAAQMCLKADFVNLAFAGLFPGLNAKKFDVVTAAVGITAQRAESLDFVPYFLGGLRLITKTNGGLRFQHEQEACGYSIGALAGSVEDRDLAKYKGNCPPSKPMDVKTYPSNNEVVEQLHKGTIQIAFLDWPLAAYTVSQSNGELMIASPVLTGEPPGEPRHREGITFRKGDAELEKAVSQAFANIEKNGTYEKILSKWNLAEGDIRKAT
ncbi:MAG: transporter substrate-binding domain-containing protein [Candidatus Eremiobacteraeota bacterium]|nr:transporter substrate-binding domain-containing protein [Candidatus Eremiobacteraeota bacterium]MBV8355904.1 transporter substrate-binding domain-containing protein [Candidatus Eremiobacteraeota bacterium]